MNKKIIIPGLVFLVLCSIYLYGEFFQQDFRGPTAEKKILSMDRDQLVRIRIFGSATNSIDISRASSLAAESPLLHRANWVLKDPTFAPVSEETLENLLSHIEKISGDPYTEPADEASVGLRPPELILILDYRSGTQETVSFGAKSEITQKRFLQKEGASVLYQTVKDFPRYVSGIQDKIKSREVLKVNPDLVTGIDVIESQGYFRVLSQRCTEEASDEWMVMSDQKQWKGDRDFISRKIRELSNLKVKRIFETPVDIFSFTGLEDPFLVLNLSFQIDDSGIFVCDLKRKRELLLQFGKGLGLGLSGQGSISTETSYYLKIGGEVRIYEIEKGFFSDWLQGAGHFRARCPFCDLPDPETISSLSVIDSERSCSIVLGKESLGSRGDLLRDVMKSVQGIRFDALLTESEAARYEGNAGIGIEFSSGDDQFSFSVTGRIVQDSDEELPQPYTLKVKRFKEDYYFGVVQEDLLFPVQEKIKTICEDGIQ